MLDMVMTVEQYDRYMDVMTSGRNSSIGMRH